jgi:rhomboid protease GluP
MSDVEPVEAPLSPLHRRIGDALYVGMLNPWMTRGIVGLVVAIHFYVGVRMWLAHRTGLVGVLLGQRDLATLDAVGAMRGLRVSGGEYWRLVSCILLHGSGMHILLNAIALFALGRLCESVYGPVRLLFLFMMSGIGGSLLSWAGGNANSVGASGAIFGLMGAAIVFGFRFQKELPPMAGELFRKRLLPYVGLNLLIGLMVPFIDNLAHVGGLVGGSLLALVLRNRVIPRKEGTLAGTIATGIVGGGLLLVGLLGVSGVLR